MDLYYGMDREALKAAYDCTKNIDDFPKALTEMQDKSRAEYAQRTCEKNISYGNAERTTLDFFPAGKQGAPLFIFIHGGYWQSCQKEDFAFVAEGPLANGYHVILLEYTIAPAASMTQIVGEIKLALDFIQAHADRFSIDRSKVCLSGHSAGGHLAAQLREHPLITHVMPISPLVELQPMQHCWLNDALSLTDQEVIQYSPLRHIKKGVPTCVVVGGSELPGLLQQANDYYEALVKCDNSVIWLAPAGHNHFSVLNTLADPTGEMSHALRELIKL